MTDNTVAIRSAIESRGFLPTTSGAGSPPAAISPPDATEILKQLTRTRKKIETMEETLQNRLAVVVNEVIFDLLRTEYYYFNIWLLGENCW